MARPRGGRLPKDVTKAAGVTATEFIDIGRFNGAPRGPWQPASTGETVSFVWYQPKYDVASALNVRVHWSTANTTASNSVTFRVRYGTLTIDTTAAALGTTALDTVIVADNPTTTAHSYMRTAAGVLAAGTVTDGQAIVLALNANAASGITLGAGASDNVNVYGVELEYVVTNLD